MFTNGILSQWFPEAARPAYPLLLFASDAGAFSGGSSFNMRRGLEKEAPQLSDVAIVFGSAIEADALSARMSNKRSIHAPHFRLRQGFISGRRMLLMEAGYGRKAAERATEALIAGHKPPWVISAGFASALTEKVRRGEILMATSVCNEAGDRLGIDLRMSEDEAARTPGLQLGRLLTVDSPVSSPESRRALGAKFEADALDEETWSVADVCRKQNVRFLAVRVITTSVGDEVPREVGALLRRRTLPGKLGAMTGALLRRPGSIKELFQARERALAASERLAAFLTGVIPQLLGETPPPAPDDEEDEDSSERQWETLPDVPPTEESPP